MKANSLLTNIGSAISKHLKVFRIIAAVIAFAMIAWLLSFAFSLVGNPVSYFIFKGKAEKYVTENYADKGYVLDSVFYNFKFGKFGGRVVKPGSDDGTFTLGLNSDGGIGDDYESRVLNGVNTQTRLEARYREFVKSFFKSSAYPYSDDTASGILVFQDDYNNKKYGFGLSKSILAPDAPYDIIKLGEEAGLLSFYIDTEEITPERAAEILLEMNSLMERGGVPFYAVDLTLRAPLGDDGSRVHGEYYSVEGFRRSDIYENGLVERIKENHLMVGKHMAELEAEKKLS